jgi:pSer/pThr/pTyr-binding forkhead associated (FHA) protein
MLAMGEDACCGTCGKYAGQEPAAVVERAEMAGPISRFKIVVIAGRDMGREITPTKEIMIIGRARDADIQLADSALSRRQACLVFRNDGVYVKDLRSTCGTFVDGRRVDNMRLRDGSLVEFGDSALRVIER